MPKILIELDIEGTEADALHAVEAAMPALVAFVDEHECDDGGCDAGPATVKFSGFHFVPALGDSRGVVRLDMDGDLAQTTLDQFFEDNAEGLDAGEADAIRALSPGETYQGGGGASCPWTVTMVSRPTGE